MVRVKFAQYERSDLRERMRKERQNIIAMRQPVEDSADMLAHQTTALLRETSSNRATAEEKDRLRKLKMEHQA